MSAKFHKILYFSKHFSEKFICPSKLYIVPKSFILPNFHFEAPNWTNDFSQFCKRQKFEFRMHTAFYRKQLKSSFLISLVRTFIPENKLTVGLTYFFHNASI